MFPMLEEIAQCQRADREHAAAERRFVAAARTGEGCPTRGWAWSERLQSIRRLVSPRVTIVVGEVLS
jgi:hypothetical protein